MARAYEIRMGFECMTDQDVQYWADLIKEYPEAAWVARISGATAFLAVNFVWWLIELPNLVNAHSDGLLLTAFAGSFGLVIFNVVSVVWAFRCSTRISATIDAKGKSDD